jgi:phospholipase/carboxylesterase
MPRPRNLRRNLSRRRAIQLGLGAAGAIALGCDSDGPLAPGKGEIDVRHHGPNSLALPGTHEIDVGDFLRKVTLRVPPGHDGTIPAPLAMLFHGAGGKGAPMVEAFAPWADAEGMILVASDALYVTWDGINGPFGHDLDFASVALDVAFDRCRVDASRIGLAGFSDGATYAVALGRASGGLISRVAGFSAGFLIEVDPKGHPDFFLSHGVDDGVLPIDITGRPVSAALDVDYDVQYVEFDGGHIVPDPVADLAMPWLAAPRS